MRLKALLSAFGLEIVALFLGVTAAALCGGTLALRVPLFFNNGHGAFIYFVVSFWQGFDVH
jgi:hypothetical protein